MSDRVLALLMTSILGSVARSTDLLERQRAGIVIRNLHCGMGLRSTREVLIRRNAPR
jgi:hypothetical protein